MSFGNPAGLWLALLALPIIALHILRPRREVLEVSSTFLWQTLAKPVAAAAPWQRLRPSVLLLLQLLAVALLTVGFARPQRPSETQLAAHTVFIIDASGSMAALDGEPERLDDAKEEARRLRAQMPDEAIASIVVADSRPRVALSASGDDGAFASALGPIDTSAGGADFGGAFSLAESLETGDTPIGFVLLSDGRISGEERALIPPGTRHIPIGRDATNRSIGRLTVEPRGAGLFARVTVQNNGGADATQTLRLDVDGRTVETVELELASGAFIVHETALPPGDRVVALLEGEDLLDADDRAYAVAPQRRAVKVLHAGPDNPFLDDLLSSISGLELTRVAAPDATDGAAGYDFAVFDRVAVPADPQAPFLAIAAPNGVPGPETAAGEPTDAALSIVGTTELPVLTLVDGNDALLEGLDLSDVAIAEAQLVEAPTSEVLVGAENTPLLLRGKVGDWRYTYLTFELAQSNLPIQLAFPILGDRLVSELSGATLPPAGVEVGSRLAIDVPGAITVESPAGRGFELPPGAAAPLADRPGFWTLTGTDGVPRTFAVNAAPGESQVEPTDEIPFVARPVAAGQEPLRGVTSILLWFGLALLAILVLEYLFARRSVGVRKQQWQWAQVARAVVAALVIIALIGPTFSRPANDVATVFVIDGSDSLGRQGRADAVAWVREAIEQQPKNAKSGVVVFGKDGRLDLPVGNHDGIADPSVRIDRGATNLAGALRLAGAVLPSDSRRRIVVLSDGRVNAGDDFEEASLLAQSGIQVDVHTVARADGPDAAVTDIEVPATVRKGERLPITATIESITGGSAEVTLRRDADVIERRSVELDPGENTIVFDQTLADEGLARYRVDVTTAGDVVSENDTAYTAVQVEGSARVLVAEGMPGEAEGLAEALRAGGLTVDLIDANEIPAIDRLASYAATVLVNVDIRNLGTRQVDAIVAATRDLGRGLVTIGGNRSYGPGGYLESDLEEVLPVISEVTDPLRRQTVAEVLAIDTSGSMGNCHCQEENNGVPGGMFDDEGGVNKTDISRAAAARAIDALSPSDEVGVLAFSGRERWVIDLQKVPSDEVVTSGLRTLFPDGGTDISRSLATSAEALRGSSATLKHIILFTDGFTEPGTMNGLAGEAADLYAEGITVSVVATGEGASRELEEIAQAGGGRFYPGRDLEQIPEIIAEETVTASRSFINEGQYFPEITGSSDMTDDLASSPPLFGFVATTSKGLARTLLRIGPDRDPLLVTWQAGLGRSTAWTSDASQRWSQQWSDWDGYVGFWSTVVKDTFPQGADGGAVRSRVSDGKLQIRVEGENAFPDGSTAVARVSGPDLEGTEITLERVSGNEFAAEISVGDAGTYAVGVVVDNPATGDTVLAAGALANQSYSAEYRPGRSEPERLERISEQTSGRGEILPEQAFDRADLPTGTRDYHLRWWFLLAAALLWPFAVALSRLSFSRSGFVETTQDGADKAGAWIRDVMPARPGTPGWQPPSPPPPSPPGPQPPQGAPPWMAGQSPMPPPPPPPAPGQGRPWDSAQPPPPGVGQPPPPRVGQQPTQMPTAPPTAPPPPSSSPATPTTAPPSGGADENTSATVNRLLKRKRDGRPPT